MTMIDMRASSPSVIIPNIVQLVNESAHPFNMKYGPNHRLVLAPHGAVGPDGQPTDRLTVNEEVAWQFLGRWWLDNADPRNRDRVAEYKRLRTLYGAYEDDIAWEHGDLESHNIPRKPGIKAYTVTGKQIVTVIDDPDGTESGAQQTSLGREMSLETQLATLQNHVLALQAQMGREQAEEINEGQPTVPTDDPPLGVQTPTHATPNTRPMGTVGDAVKVPIAPPTIEYDDPDEGEVFGTRLPVTTQVVHDPSEVAVEEDAPPAIAHGPSATGGRVSG